MVLPFSSLVLVKGFKQDGRKPRRAAAPQQWGKPLSRQHLSKKIEIIISNLAQSQLISTVIKFLELERSNAWSNEWGISRIKIKWRIRRIKMKKGTPRIWHIHWTRNSYNLTDQRDKEKVSNASSCKQVEWIKNS